MSKELLSGNEAIARGAYEAGCSVGTGYPGTPSTEIIENLAKYEAINTEWSVNEKVALEVGLGAAWAGARTLVTMKHVGVNVAADPLFTSSYTGIKGGLVIVTADDPDMHSSQNEQDNRYYAKSAKIPMLEPANSMEAKEFTKLAFQISEKYDTPVFLRITTRLAHSYSIVETAERATTEVTGFDRDRSKYVMIPAFARKRHVIVEERQAKLVKASNEFDINHIENSGTADIGIITAGIPYNYVKEVCPDAAILKLGMVFPLPEKLLQEFCDSVKEVWVVEELEPFFEDKLKAMGIKVHGKDRLPILGEYSPNLLDTVINKQATPKAVDLQLELPPRPPQLCQGCPHCNVYEVLSKMNLTVTGDIGCYTLGVLPPYSAMDTCLDMGASITVAQGMEMALGPDAAKGVVSVTGDSTFAHSGITGLVNAAYNKRHGLMIILDNATTAMTGMQPNPLTGENIYREETVTLDYRKLGEACGLKPENIKIVDAYKKAEVEQAIIDLHATGELALLVVYGLCIIERHQLQKIDKLESKLAIRKARLDVNIQS